MGSSCAEGEGVGENVAALGSRLRFGSEASSGKSHSRIDTSANRYWDRSEIPRQLAKRWPACRYWALDFLVLEA